MDKFESLVLRTEGWVKNTVDNAQSMLSSINLESTPSMLLGLVSASPNPGDPTLKNNDVTPKMAQADDGWPDAFYNTNNNNDSNHSTGSVPTDADVVIKNEDDVTEPRDNASDVTSQQSVSLGSSTPKGECCILFWVFPVIIKAWMSFAHAPSKTTKKIIRSIGF